MYKNQLQELAQRSCFNLPSYSCIREGPDHAPRFKAKVNFNGEVFESSTFCSTLRQAEHAAADVALKTLSTRGPSRTLAARVLDETGVYKNLLQETAHRAGLKLPVYTTVRSRPGHVPLFTCSVELGGMSFTGEPARTKKQAQKSVAMTAWFALKNLSQSGSSSSHLSEFRGKDEQEQVTVARYLASLQSVETKKLIRRERVHERLELAPLMKEVISYQAGGRPFYPIQCQSCALSPFYPELAMYQSQQQQRVSEQQSFPLALPSTPTSVPRPRFFPFVQSIIPFVPEPMPLLPGVGPIFYFSDCSMPETIRSLSRVTIKEIEDENTLVEENSLSSNGNSSVWKLNSLSNASGLSPTEGPNRADSLSTHSGLRIQELMPGKDKKYSDSAPRNRNSIQKGIYPKEELGSVPPGFLQFGRRPRATRTDDRLCPQNPNSSSFMWSNVRPQNPPVTNSPRLTGTKSTRGVHCASSIAPAVHIRTVIPVCSAPPARRMEGTSQAGIFPSGGTKKAGERVRDIPTAT